MDKNQSEQQYYLSNLGTTSIISPAQFQCNLIGSNKNSNHTMVPNSNSSLNYNTKYQNTSNDFKLAQNITSSNVHNFYTNITKQNDELKYLLSNSKSNKKQHTKRNINTKLPSQCLNNNDNSSDITAAPNQLTILVQEVLPAQVPDNPILTTSTIPSHLSIKAHSNIISAAQLNEKVDLSIKKELLTDKQDVLIFSPISKDSEPVSNTTATIPLSTNINESKDTISEVIKEVLIKALSSDPHEDVFLSVIKSRDNVTRPFVDGTTLDGVEVSSRISSPILSNPCDNDAFQRSIHNSTVMVQCNPDSVAQPCRQNKTNNNFIHPPFLNQADAKPSAVPIANDVIKSNLIAQSFSKSDFFPPSNCQIQQKSKPNDDGLLHPIGEPVVSKSNKRRNPTVPKTASKKQKLNEPTYHDKLTIPFQRYQQTMVKQLGAPIFKRLVHEPRIKNSIAILSPLGFRSRFTSCSNAIQLQDNCVKYRRVPFTLPQINPVRFINNDRQSSENSFILQNINVNIPEGELISTHDSDDIDCLVAPSPANHELDYLSAFNCESISSPSVNLSGPNLEMLHPPNRTQSPQLSVFHCPNKDYLKFDQSDLSISNRRMEYSSQSVLRATGISRVQISHKYSSVSANEPIPDNALIDSETGEVVSKPINDQSRPNKPREKLLVTFTINPPDNVEKTVRNITDALGIDYSSVEFKETTQGGEIAIDKDSIGSNEFPKDICERYNTSMVINNPLFKMDGNQGANRTFDSFISTDKVELPLYSEKVYKSTALIHSNNNNRPSMKCSNCDKPIPIDQRTGFNIGAAVCDRLKLRDLSFCDETCQQQYYSLITIDDNENQGTTTNNNIYSYHNNHTTNTNNSTNFNTITSSNNQKCPDLRDQCIFVGDDLSDISSSVIVQGSISKSRQISKRLGALINDKLFKKKAATVPTLKACHKIHKGTKYHSFHSTTHLEQHSSIISDNHFNKLSSKSKVILRHGALKDRRFCSLCQRIGDLPENGAGRLLCFDVDKWLHVNCALWCNNVYEMQCGALQNVSESFETAMKTVCSSCNKVGAGIACYYPRCTLKYHVPCAQEKGCLFFSDRAMYCQLHQTKDLDTHLTTLHVDRQIYISRDEMSQVARIINNNSNNDDDDDNNEDREENFHLRIGSLIVTSIGQLLPHQINSGHFHTLNHIYPAGFKSRRIHWSSRIVNVRSGYECEILTQKNDWPLFKVTAIDDGMENEYYFGSSCAESWNPILEKISQLRKSSGLVKLFPDHVKAEDLFGLTEPHVLRAIESLPGLESLSDYAFKFGKMQLIVEMPLPVNSSGSIRTEPYVKLHRFSHKPVHQSPTFMRNLLTSKHEATSLHSKTTLTNKWQQYRKLRVETKLNVVLKRSKIQGFGLFALRDIEKGTMIIEYVGELIRNEVANIREKQYESKKQGVYMFRLDSSTIIDATRAGDLARYINHCCDPNCFTELLDFEKESHIVIISNRKIEKGEELTYDYKFDLDDGKEDKIPCMCGARNCKRWMN